MKFSQLGWKSLLSRSLRSLASEECFSLEKKTLIPEEHSQFLKFLFRQIKISFPMAGNEEVFLPGLQERV